MVVVCCHRCPGAHEYWHFSDRYAFELRRIPCLCKKHEDRSDVHDYAYNDLQMDLSYAQVRVHATYATPVAILQFICSPTTFEEAFEDTKTSTHHDCELLSLRPTLYVMRKPFEDLKWNFNAPESQRDLLRVTRKPLRTSKETLTCHDCKLLCLSATSHVL